jgi:hypothetical protein
MLRLERLLVEIESLPTEDYTRLRRWFSERDWEKWDARIEMDSQLGRLDFLINEAKSEKQLGELRVL